MCLDVQGGSLLPGAPLCQWLPNAANEAQKFRFEDAGNGFFYIRTLAGLYVTANPPVAGTGAITGIKQDFRYEAGGLAAQNPDLQKWKFTSSSIVAANQSSYAVSCAAVPGKVLQPADGSAASGAAVVLGDPAVTHSPVVVRNPWTVTSPLLPPTQIVNK
jgi:hypothetical protein